MRARAIPLAADATVPAAPAARRNERRLHVVDLIKNLLDLSGVHFDDHIIRERKRRYLAFIRNFRFQLYLSAES
jgi:hypothetical protein